MRQRDLPILAALAAFLLTPAQVPAQAQAPTIKFTENTPFVAVTLKPGGVDTTTLAIQNGGRTAATISSVSFTFVGRPAPKVTLAPPRARLEPGAVTAVRVVLTDAGGRGISGMGYLVLRTDLGPLTRMVKISPPTDEVPVTRWTTTASMACFPGFFGCTRASLPVSVDTAARAELLRKTKSGSYDGKATAEPTRSGNTSESTKLTISGLDGPGTYMGPLPVGNGSVELTVHARHWVVWLVLALMLGVLNGMWMSHYTGVRRALWEFRAECGELDERLRALLVQGGLTPDTATLRTRVTEALRSVEALGSAAFRPIEEDAGYTAAVATLRDVEAALLAWSGLPAKLARVRQARAAAEEALRGASRPSTPDATPLTFPKMVEWARLQTAERTLPLEDAAALSARLDEAPGALELIVALNSAALAAQHWIDVLHDRLTDESEKATLEETQKQLSAAWWEVWYSDDPAKLAANQTQNDLASIQQALVRFNRRLPNDAERLRAAFADERDRVGEKAFRLDTSAATQQPRAQPRRDWRFWRRLIASWDRTFMVLALILALLTGLKEFYFDKPFFGTAADYAGALLWGFGVKTGLDLIVASVGKLFGRRGPVAPGPVLPTPVPGPVGGA